MRGVHPFRVLCTESPWAANGVITGVPALLFAVFSIGADIGPVDHLTKLPADVLDAHKEASLGSKHVDFGARITESIKKSTASGYKIGCRQLAGEHARRAVGAVSGGPCRVLAVGCGPRLLLCDGQGCSQGGCSAVPGVGDVF
ncbi:hypothetical protein [Streptomyces sp. NPDC002328]|uniref:hypothetical protein n=1 Tax=Streptomyces sp. NPDC002328 TaxID=3364642 RepID=UPI0036A0671E